MELSGKIKRIYIYYRPIFLVLPAFIIFLIFFVIPVAGLFVLAFDKPVAGVIDIQAQWTFKSFVRIYSRSLYFDAVVTSVSLAAIVSFIALIIADTFATYYAIDDIPGMYAILFDIFAAPTW